MYTSFIFRSRCSPEGSFPAAVQLCPLVPDLLGENWFSNVVGFWPQLFVALEKTDAGVPAQNRVIVACGAHAFRFFKQHQGLDEPIVNVATGARLAGIVICLRPP